MACSTSALAITMVSTIGPGCWSGSTTASGSWSNEVNRHVRKHEIRRRQQTERVLADVADHEDLRRCVALEARFLQRRSYQLRFHSTEVFRLVTVDVARMYSEH